MGGDREWGEISKGEETDCLWPLSQREKKEEKEGAWYGRGRVDKAWERSGSPSDSGSKSPDGRVSGGATTSTSKAWALEHWAREGGQKCSPPQKKPGHNKGVQATCMPAENVKITKDVIVKRALWWPFGLIVQRVLWPSHLTKKIQALWACGLRYPQFA